MKNKKTVIIFGLGGGIGSNCGKRLKETGNYYVIGVDIKSKKEASEFSNIKNSCHKYYSLDLTDYRNVTKVLNLHKDVEYLYQFAANMGGIFWITDKNNDAQIMSDSALINLNTARALDKLGLNIRVLFSSSACRYNEKNQEELGCTGLKEDSYWPAAPDTLYGLEKIFSEKLYKAYNDAGKFKARIAIFHNIFMTNHVYEGGKEKAPAALAKKVAICPDGGEIEVVGNGLQERSFLWIDECLDAIIKLIDSDIDIPLNVGSSELISINDLAKLIIKISGKNITIKNIPGPVGVKSRNSDNTLIREKLGWDYKQTLEDGLKKLYPWIVQQVDKKKLNKE